MDIAFRMWHQTEDATGRVTSPGNVRLGSVWIKGKGSHLVGRLEMRGVL